MPQSLALFSILFESSRKLTSLFIEQVKLAHHAYSCLFGTFLCNSESERLKANIFKRTFSLWSLLKLKNKEFKNFLYSSSSEQVTF